MQSESSATFVVHNLADAKRALEIAKTTGLRVTLLSDPGAASLPGPRVFNEMILAAATETGCQKQEFDAVLDCGPAPGAALRAIREGCTHIFSSAPAETIVKIQDIAASSGTRVVSRPFEAIDLSACELDDANLITRLKTSDSPFHV